MRTRAAALYSALRKDLGVHIDLGAPIWGPDSSPRDVACYSLLSSFLKKYNEDDSVPSHLYSSCWKQFKQDSEKCWAWELKLNTSLDEILWGGFQSHVHKFFDMCNRTNPEIIYDFGSMYRAGRSGPGASVHAQGGDFYTKHFSSVVGASARLLPIWELLRRRTFGSLDTRAEDIRSARFGDPIAVEASRFGCVPKNDREARSISTEPAANMFLQLGFGSMLETRLRSYFGIDIRGREEDLSNQQVRNRHLAYLGSRDGTFATVDLSKASNLIATSMLRLCIPREAMQVIEVLRSEKTHDLASGEMITLGMVGTMGNGFTFPLMTAVLACAVYSVYDSLGLRPVEKSQGFSRTVRFGVFGDDIIVVSEAIPRLYRLLDILGFVVNAEKSFIDGPFRESCGADFMAGYNVRGVYAKRLSTRNDLFAIINALSRWSATHGVNLNNVLREALNFAVGDSLVTRFAVPLHESDIAGLAIPRILLPLSKRDKNGTMVYRRYEPQKWEFIITGGHCWTYRGQKHRLYNPDGLIICYLTGHCRDGFISLRPRRVKYRRTKAITPHWDYLPPDKFALGNRASIRQLATVWMALVDDEGKLVRED